jgi:hypothetical protein
MLFREDGTVELLTGGKVTGFQATVQRALLNLMVTKGSDPIFPLRGTDLLTRALGGTLLNLRAAEHAGNFASSDTLFFGRQNDLTDSSVKMAAIQLSVASLSLNLLDLEAAFLSISGENVSFKIKNSLPL